MIMGTIFSKVLTLLTPLAGVGLLAQLSTGELPNNWMQLGVSGGCLFVMLAQMFIHQRTIRDLAANHLKAMEQLVDAVKKDAK